MLSLFKKSFILDVGQRNFENCGWLGSSMNSMGIGDDPVVVSRLFGNKT